MAFAQGVPPRISAVEPGAGKAGATITANGENLGKQIVVAVFLSDSDADHKAVVVEQTAEKIVLRVPAVKPGSYNLSVQVKNDIFIQPVRFTVE
jgi:hypothetical protein